MKGNPMNLNDMTVTELRKLAASFEVSGRSTMRKAELVSAIEAAEIAAESVELFKQADEQASKTDIDPELAAAVEAATKEHEDEEIDLTSTIDSMIEGWVAPKFANEVAILRDAPGRAIVTAAVDGQTFGASVKREGKRLVLTYGRVKLRARSYAALAKRFAGLLGFHADIIDVQRGF
jgi:hypothetical protein